VEKSGESKSERKQNRRKSAGHDWREEGVGRCDCAEQKELDWAYLGRRWTVERGNGRQNGRKESLR
jgi:hypothetical protein